MLATNRSLKILDLTKTFIKVRGTLALAQALVHVAVAVLALAVQRMCVAGEEQNVVDAESDDEHARRRRCCCSLCVHVNNLWCAILLALFAGLIALGRALQTNSTLQELNLGAMGIGQQRFARSWRGDLFDSISRQARAKKASRRWRRCFASIAACTVSICARTALSPLMPLRRAADIARHSSAD